MQALVLYFNEVSCPASVQPALNSGGVWREWALTLWDALYDVRHSQGEYWLWFPEGIWHSLYSQKPLSVWLQIWLGRDRYRRLLSMIRNTPHAPDLYREVYFDNRAATGLTLALLTRGWAFSFPIEGSAWLVPSVAARVVTISDDGDTTEGKCEISHISKQAHVDHWRKRLTDFGREIASENEIANLAGYAIHMYPLDHGYPHLHLAETRSPYRTLAKFRVDSFARIEGRPDWDGLMYEWIRKHRQALMLSWNRCQRGGHPYRITAD